MVDKVCVWALSGITAFVGLGLVLGVCELFHPSDEAYFVGILALGFCDIGFQHNYPILLSMMYILCYSNELVLHVSLVLSYFIYLYYE
jgi:hypothetical protein